MKNVRLDNLLIEYGLAEDIESAKRLIMAGKVRIGEHVADKPGVAYPHDADISVDTPSRFVSRGGEKLETAFENFGLNVTDRVCIDIGSSTGGFTDCLLQHGATRVYAVDCGRGQLDWNLRQDERVVVMENRNARYLEPEEFNPRPSFAVIDASFISLTKLLPTAQQLLVGDGEIVALIKPQFEARREQVEPGGVIRDPGVHREVTEKVRHFAKKSLGLIWRGVVESSIKGPAGNKEFLAYWSLK